MKTQSLEENLQAEIDDKEIILKDNQEKIKELEDLTIRSKKDIYENKKLKENNILLKNENDHLRNECKSLKTDNSNLNKYVINLEKDIQDNSDLMNVQKENEVLNAKISAQKERISHLETTLKTSSDKPPKPRSSLKPFESISHDMESSNIPTFTNNIFTLSDEENKDQEFNTISNEVINIRFIIDFEKKAICNLFRNLKESRLEYLRYLLKIKIN